MFSRAQIRFGFRTCMMNFPKGADRYRKENQYIESLAPGLNYGVVIVSEKNYNFINPIDLGGRVLLEPTPQVTEPTPPEPIAYKEDLEETIKFHRLSNQTLWQFMLESIKLRKPQHKLFWAVCLAGSVSLIKAIIDEYYPRLYGAGRVTTTKTVPFDFHFSKTSFALDQLNETLDMFDHKYSQLLERARRGEM